MVINGRTKTKGLMMTRNKFGVTVTDTTQVENKLDVDVDICILVNGK